MILSNFVLLFRSFTKLIDIYKPTHWESLPHKKINFDQITVSWRFDHVEPPKNQILPPSKEDFVPSNSEKPRLLPPTTRSPNYDSYVYYDSPKSNPYHPRCIVSDQ